MQIVLRCSVIWSSQRATGLRVINSLYSPVVWSILWCVVSYVVWCHKYVVWCHMWCDVCSVVFDVPRYQVSMAAVIPVRAWWLQAPPPQSARTLQFSFQSLPDHQPVHTSLTPHSSHLSHSSHLTPLSHLTPHSSLPGL